MPFTYFFVVAVHYITGKQAFFYGPTFYNWHFERFLHLHDVVVNTTSLLLKHTFEAADRYKYHLWVSNAVSTVYTEESFTGKNIMVVVNLIVSFSSCC